MPKGTHHKLTGTLRWTRLGYVLAIADGGQWRLDVGRRAAKMVGREVTVEGLRSGFDLLDVHRIELLGAANPPSVLQRLRATLKALR